MTGEARRGDDFAARDFGSASALAHPTAIRGELIVASAISTSFPKTTSQGLPGKPDD